MIKINTKKRMAAQWLKTMLSHQPHLTRWMGPILKENRRTRGPAESFQADIKLIFWDIFTTGF